MLPVHEAVYDLCPQGMTERAIKEYVLPKIDEVVAVMPTLEALPDPSEIADLNRSNPEGLYKLRSNPTLGNIRDHLLSAGNTTPEIGITIFSDGPAVCTLGDTTDVVAHPDYWGLLNQLAPIDFHTHPYDPAATDQTIKNAQRLPGFLDLLAARTTARRSALLGTAEGMTHYGGPSTFEWRDYVIGRGFDRRSFDAYGSGRLFSEFVRDRIKVSQTGWLAMDPRTTLVEFASTTTL